MLRASFFVIFLCFPLLSACVESSTGVQEVQKVRQSVTQPGTLKLSIVSPSSPVKGATVQLKGPEGATSPLDSSLTSDLRGNIEVADLKAGTYSIKVSASPYPDHTESFTVPEKGLEKQVLLSTDKKVAVSFDVLNATGTIQLKATDRAQGLVIRSQGEPSNLTIDLPEGNWILYATSKNRHPVVTSLKVSLSTPSAPPAIVTLDFQESEPTPIIKQTRLDCAMVPSPTGDPSIPFSFLLLGAVGLVTGVRRRFRGEF